MIKFTKEEISLFKQVAEGHKKIMNYGDWFILKDDPHQVPMLYVGQVEVLRHNSVFFFSISDCLGFLRERNFEMSLCYFNKFNGYRIQIWKPGKTQAFYSDYDLERSVEQCTHKTPLEACLRAVLAVLEEEK